MTRPMRALRERDIEAHLVKRVKALGGVVRKVRWIECHGAPDRIVMLPERNNPLDGSGCGRISAECFWVELKAPGEKPEPHQLREHKRLRKMGQRVFVVDSIEGVERLFF